jgi:hypothetical protein
MFDNYIDFDEASREWRKNKKKQPDGGYGYMCHYIHSKSGNQGSPNPSFFTPFLLRYITIFRLYKKI